MKKLFVFVSAMVILAAVVWGPGAALAWLFAQFGIVHPWYVFSVAWLFVSLLARGGAAQAKAIVGAGK